MLRFVFSILLTLTLTLSPFARLAAAPAHAVAAISAGSQLDDPRPDPADMSSAQLERERESPSPLCGKSYKFLQAIARYHDFSLVMLPAVKIQPVVRDRLRNPDMPGLKSVHRPPVHITASPFKLFLARTSRLLI